MRLLAENICAVLNDYHSQHNFKFTPDHVLRWVNQFDELNRQFLLEEFLHLLNRNVYISERMAREILINKIKNLISGFKLKNGISFLENTKFLHMQGEHKSQTVLLKMLDSEIQNAFGIGLNDCGNKSEKYNVYFDDLLATGGTIYNHLKNWLSTVNNDGETNFQKVIKDEKILIISLICKHTWGAENVKWRLKFDFNNDALSNKILYQSHYVIENHPSKLNEKLNFAYPLRDGQPQKVFDYLDGLNAQYKGEYAFRRNNTPPTDNFFSSALNRQRFENILLEKGIDLLNQAHHLEANQRPLGMTNPSKKILGTGTLFFTWRNISNTTPIVFWWGNNWFPLFPLTNRGN